VDTTGNRAVIGEFLEAAERRDFDAMARLAHDDIVMEWPQSGERFRGKENALGAMDSQEQKPEFAGEPRVIGSGEVWVVMMPLRYGDEVHHYVGVLELEDGKVRRTTEYFGAPFPAQDFRAKFRDRG
jgi:ketosteroid isomerase-like protein